MKLMTNCEDNIMHFGLAKAVTQILHYNFVSLGDFAEGSGSFRGGFTLC